MRRDMVRRFVQVALLIPSALFFLLGFLDSTQGDSSLDHTFDNNRIIENVFAAAHEKIEGWKAEHGRLPTSEEFAAWANSQPDAVLGMRSVEFWLNPNVLADLPPEYAQIPPDGYLLTLWRGEWMEYSPSWTKKSSIEMDRSKYFIFGSARLQGLFWFGISLLFAGGAYLARPRAA